MKNYVRTPREITPELLAFCKNISSDEPFFIDIVPSPEAKSNACFLNVAECVRMHGGELVFGWYIGHWPRVMVEAVHHGVWRGQQGFVDITPDNEGEVKRLFVPDAAASFDFVGLRPNPSVRRAVGGAKEPTAFVREYDQFIQFQENHRTPGKLEMKIPLLQLRQHQASAAAATLDLLGWLSKTTNRNDPCFCGSGKKYKRCCLPMVNQR